MTFLQRRTLGAVMLGLALVSGATPAWAHERSGSRDNRPVVTHPAPIKGLVTGVTATTVRVQTASGSVTVTVNGSTKVARVVNGSTADLRTGEWIDAAFAGGTTTLRTIRIDAAQGHVPPPNWSTSRSGSRNGTTGSHGGTGSRTGSHQGAPVQTHGAEGQVISVSSGSITLRGRNGQAGTYALASGVTVTKVVVGRLGDLAVGETVQVCASSGTLAAFITILSL